VTLGKIDTIFENTLALKGLRTKIRTLRLESAEK